MNGSHYVTVTAPSPGGNLRYLGVIWLLRCGLSYPTAVGLDWLQVITKLVWNSYQVLLALNLATTVAVRP
ncbi:hypothetical protein J6590_036072 [Homalodisca vitripennis]|nr:hypothetical protein J6590_036072 [Homalodisca vitripennis]